MDYSRIFQFQDFNRAKKKALSKAPEGLAEVGNAIFSWPPELHNNHPNGHPLIMSGLLAHEQKMSVMHFAIKRHFTSEEPIKSKERLIFQVGYRRFSACPIFSEHTVGNRQKYERFLPKDTSVVVATVYAPICFPPSSVLVFKENSSGLHALVATGTTLGSNPDRIVVKRAVLSGHPFKIINRTAVVRYMFSTERTFYGSSPWSCVPSGEEEVTSRNHWLQSIQWEILWSLGVGRGDWRVVEGVKRSVFIFS
ncbi:putative pre-rRNA-processing protein TSR1-like [Apostichopus japonicus]|uniref:Pre-rRNA-processing protein TSR1 homolog n=1 Tax=Stichopus japonicus TaxID=307972 RepID=A0A2G8KW07_STIJA|nr:putative pre-rRNA-processing protein TSR1-like [Apostichopus japonicus]